jgi:hypothetical protein
MDAREASWCWPAALAVVTFLAKLPSYLTPALFPLAGFGAFLFAQSGSST